MTPQITTDLSNIQVWDDLIDDRFLLDLDEESNKYPWTLTNVANRKSFPYKKKGSHLFWGVDIPLDNVPKNIEKLYHYIIDEVIGHPFKLNIIQLNGQSLGQNGAVHIDNLQGTGEKTLMVFISYKWQTEWGGSFQILKEYNNNSEVIKNIEYIPGRIILFDGNLPHRGLAPLEPYVIRKSLVFRLGKYE